MYLSYFHIEHSHFSEIRLSSKSHNFLSLLTSLVITQIECNEMYVCIGVTDHDRIALMACTDVDTGTGCS